MPPSNQGNTNILADISCNRLRVRIDDDTGVDCMELDVTSNTPAPISCSPKKVVVCHIPPGNPANAHNICISPNGVPAHIAHGCSLGPCDPCNTNKANLGFVEQQHSEIQLGTYPNPFTAKTTVHFKLPQSGSASLELFDLAGRQIAVLFNAMAAEGQTYSVPIDGTNYMEGMYILRLRSPNVNKIEKLLLMKLAEVRNGLSSTPPRRWSLESEARFWGLLPTMAGEEKAGSQSLLFCALSVPPLCGL